MSTRIFKAICLVSALVFLAALVLTIGVMNEYLSVSYQNQMRAQTVLAAQGTAHEGAEYFEGLENLDFRITWIDKYGGVLFDTQSDALSTENHMSREEVREAMETGYGESIRLSDTLTEEQLYIAMRLPDGSVVRLSGSRYTSLSLALAVLKPVLIIAAVAIVLALVLASSLAKRIAKPLNELDLDKPLSNKVYPEIRPLLERIDSQQAQLKRNTAELRRRQEEFETITSHMDEGLILLSSKGAILSINPVASYVLSLEAGEVRNENCRMTPQRLLQELCENARAGMRSEKILDTGVLRYRFNADPVLVDGAVSGISVVIFNITERERAEQMRREFSANVSHELKTPLHSISGCAELLMNGMVKPEDVPKFAGQIYTESQRMISLVGDIIRLSRLDEGDSEMKKEPLELYSAAENVVESLRSFAEKAGVTLSISGERGCILAVPQLIEGIIYNLCDNGIKYNRPGGYVNIGIIPDDDEIILKVSDNGIGIPKEHQDRIFERFYRVDKSRSKAVGGTGLGLSIVKHAAMIHDAKIGIESSEKSGTEISITFKASKE